MSNNKIIDLKQSQCYSSETRSKDGKYILNKQQVIENISKPKNQFNENNKSTNYVTTSTSSESNNKGMRKVNKLYYINTFSFS